MLRQLPNALTFSRLVLALPLGWLILQQQYGWALAVGLVAGVTDALDEGFAQVARGGERGDPLRVKGCAEGHGPHAAT